jgi:high affinity sulfate transporter 1
MASSVTEAQAPPRAEAPAERRGILRWLPGVYTLSHYEIAWLPRDIVAGLVLTAILIPAGMAYSVAAGLPPIYGLYATIVPLLAYAIFGPSRILVLGPDSSLAPMIAAAVLPLAAGDMQTAIMLAAVLAILAGLFGVLAGLLRLGFITDLLAKPIRYGYMNGIALTVLVSQVPKLFGFKVKGDELIPRAIAFGQGVMEGKTNLVALALGGAALIVILVLKRFLKVPGVLLAVGGATVAVALLGLDRYGVVILGDLPRGLPTFSIPIPTLKQIGALAAPALGIAVVSFADTSVLSRVYSAKTREHVDPNQEMFGLGAANLAAGFFQGFPISSSSSRTPVAEASGSKSQLTGVVGALAIALLLVLAPTLLHDLPETALAAVVIASAIGLFEISDLARLYRMQHFEFWLSCAAFLGVILLGPVPGILIAVGIALAEFVWDAWKPHYAVLGKPANVSGYHDVKRYPEAHQVPGLLLFRWDAPLFFANAEQFREVVTNAVATAPWPVKWLVVAAEPVTGVDITSADMLTELDAALHEAGVMMGFAEMKDPAKDLLKKFGVFKMLGEQTFFYTIEDAVNAYLAKHPDAK